MKMIRKSKVIFDMILPAAVRVGSWTPVTRAMQLAFHCQLCNFRSSHRALRVQT
jgi:hypothetical protein